MALDKTVRINLGPRSYDVRIGPGMLDTLGQAVAALGEVSQAVVISDSNVTKLYSRPVGDSLTTMGFKATLIHFPAGEDNKTLATVSQVFDRLFAVHPAIDRNTVIVALGGGVPGDLAGFVAASALRGVRWLQCPTTLLAAVDASVGGKTGVNHSAGKNLIGAFYQPQRVLIDVQTLKTLDSRELRSGLAECVKHAVIRDATLLDFLAANAAAIEQRDQDVLTELIARNVAIKAEVVAADERETGVRAHLNFGHTVGHGIETYVGYGKITHGQAVALGMIAACHIAVDKHLVTDEVTSRIRQVQKQLGLAVSWRGLDAPAIWRIMQHDKKVHGGRVRFVLPKDLGSVDIYDDVPAEQVFRAIEKLAQ